MRHLIFAMAVAIGALPQVAAAVQLQVETSAQRPNELRVLRDTFTSQQVRSTNPKAATERQPIIHRLVSPTATDSAGIATEQPATRQLVETTQQQTVTEHFDGQQRNTDVTETATPPTNFDSNSSGSYFEGPVQPTRRTVEVVEDTKRIQREPTEETIAQDTTVWQETHVPGQAVDVVEGTDQVQLAPEQDTVVQETTTHQETVAPSQTVEVVEGTEKLQFETLQFAPAQEIVIEETTIRDEAIAPRHEEVVEVDTTPIETQPVPTERTVEFESAVETTEFSRSQPIVRERLKTLHVTNPRHSTKNLVTEKSIATTVTTSAPSIVTKTKRRPARRATSVSRAQSERRGASLFWLLPLCLIPLVGWFGYKTLTRDRSSKAQATSSEPRGKFRRVENFRRSETSTTTRTTSRPSGQTQTRSRTETRTAATGKVTGSTARRPEKMTGFTNTKRGEFTSPRLARFEETEESRVVGTGNEEQSSTNRREVKSESPESCGTESCETQSERDGAKRVETKPSATRNRVGAETRPEETASSARQRSTDDLTKVKGIGPATVKLLNQSGIRSFFDLRNASLERLQSILQSGGAKFKLIDPSSWSAQANCALDGDWKAIEQWDQKESCSDTVESCGTQTESTQVARLGVKQDLTRIKGIGPATQKRLHAVGIHSFEQIAQLNGQQITELLGDANGQFALVDPETWPRQARELCGPSDASQEHSIVSEIKELSDAAAELAIDSKPEKVTETRRI